MNDVREAVADVVVAAQENAKEQVAAVIDHAAADIQAAQDNAKAIADAAMQSELGRKIEANEREISSCHANLSLIQSTMATLQTEMAELKTTLAASLTLQVAAQNPPAPAQVSLTPPISEVAAAAETVAATLPGNLSENAVSIPNEPEKVVVKTRKIFL